MCRRVERKTPRVVVRRLLRFGPVAAICRSACGRDLKQSDAKCDAHVARRANEES